MSIFQPIPGTPVYEEVRTRLCLPASCDADEEYQRILAEIYPSESAYQDILETVSLVKTVLKGFAHTNAEFYSANIFSEKQRGAEANDALSIQFIPL